MLDGYAQLALVLSGGNALGAYQAGGYAALHDHGLAPDWVVGASTGAINGAIITGNDAADRVARLEHYWRPAPAGTTPTGSIPAGSALAGAVEDQRRSAAAIAALAGGEPKLFVPDYFALPWALAGVPGTASLYDTRPLEATLARLVDFDRLNRGAPRFTATAVDLETGTPVVFDTHDRPVEARHIRASGALLPAFPPVEIDGRLLGDGGLAANLPVDVVLDADLAAPTLCLALDLLPLAARRPATLGEAASRMQDLMFASQSRLAVAAAAARYAARPDAPPVTLVHLSYDRQDAEVAGKAFDFSPISVRARWDAGYADVAAALTEVGGMGLSQRAGLTVWRPSRP